MLALILGIAAAAGWIIFDVAVSVVTYPLMPKFEWWIFVLSGAVLVILTVIAQIMEFKASQRAETKHSAEHTAIATGTLAIWERLMLATQTMGQPEAKVAEAATAKIQQLENQLAEMRGLFWRKLSEEEQTSLAILLSNLGAHRIRIGSSSNTDCIQVGRDLYRAFEAAKWDVEPKFVMTGTFETIGVSGITIRGKGDDNTQIGANVMDTLRLFFQRPIAFAASLSNSDEVDVLIVIGPKRPELTT
jgi:hypothetical protein